MVERVEVEVAAELAVDADQEVLVERRRDAERVVVGEQQLALRLDEVGAEQQQVAGSRVARMRSRKCAAAGWSKLPMFEPSNSTSIVLPRRRAATPSASPSS